MVCHLFFIFLGWSQVGGKGSLKVGGKDSVRDCQWRCAELSAQERVRCYGNMSSTAMVMEPWHGAYLYQALEFNVESNLSPI